MATTISTEIIQEYNKTREHATEHLCYAPYRNMFFTRDGHINACGWNKSHPLGKYPEQTIKEVWEGEAARELRQKIANNDLSAGCQICQSYLQARNFSNIKSKHYDNLSDEVSHSYPLRMDFALDNTCNVECLTCFGDLSSSIRKNREGLSPLESAYDEAFVEQLREFVPYLKSASFMGGEPFLVNLHFSIWHLFAELNPSADLAITTNATILNQKVKNILEQCSFDITVSRDCMDNEKLERLRKNTNGQKQLENIDFFSDYCHRNNRPFGLNAILSTLNWMDLPEVVTYCNNIGAKLYICGVMFPYQHSLRQLSASELSEVEEFLGNELVKLPEHNNLEKNNKHALEGALSHVTSLKNKAANDRQDFDIENTSNNELHRQVMKKIKEYAVNSGADEEETTNKFERALERIRQRDQQEYRQFLEDALSKEFDMLMSQVLWREESHLVDYLTSYLKAA